MQCICGRFYTPAVYTDESLDICPACINASNPTSYTSRDDYVHAHINDDSGLYSEDEVNSY